LTYEQIKQKYEAHSNLYERAIEIIKNNDLIKEFPIYYEVLTDCSERLEQIFKSLLLISEEGKIYSAQILYRAIIELFFKTFFLTSKLSTDKNDESAEHFKVHLMLSEWLAEQMGYLEMTDLINDIENKSDFVQFIRDKFPELKEFDKENQKEISNAIKKFNIKNMIAYIRESLTDKEIGNYFTKILPEYSRASSFVHGGPYATYIVKNLKDKGQIEKELERVVGVAFSCTCVAKENCLLSFKLHPDDMKDFINELREIRKF